MIWIWLVDDGISNWHWWKGFLLGWLHKVVWSLIIIHYTLILVLSLLSLASILSWISLGSIIKIPLQLGDQDLDKVHHVWSVEKINVKIAWLLLSIVLPVNSISHLLLLDFSNFFDLIEGYIELLSIKGLGIQLIFGQSS